MYTLYFSPGTCSLAVHVALLECNAQFKLERINTFKGEGQKPEYLKINPRGQVPVLLDGDQKIIEGAAILLHILDKQNSPLMPRNGKERDEAIQWLMFCNATLHPAYGRFFFLKHNASDAAKTELTPIIVKAINKLWNDVEERLSSSKYLAGDQVTIADILMTVIANWGSAFPTAPTIGPKTKQLLKDISSRPAFQKAMQEENVTYKAAA